jgi:4-amino-4-deoxychorismate lyase
MESPRPDALIETIHVRPDGGIALWPEHIRRLKQSAQTLGFASVPDDLQAHVYAAAAAVVTDDRHTAWRLRLLYGPDGTVSLAASALAPLADRPGVTWASAHLHTPNAGVLASTQALLRHKTTYRPWYAAATSWLAQRPDIFDLLFVNEAGALCEGSRTNVYAQIDGQWLTPPVQAGCLPGTVRARLLTQRLVRCATLTPKDIQQAQALRLSNGVRGWFDVVLKD